MRFDSKLLRSRPTNPPAGPRNCLWNSGAHCPLHSLIQWPLNKESNSYSKLSKEHRRLSPKQGKVLFSLWVKDRTCAYSLLLSEKTTLLKAAKDEADKEVANFRGQKEAQFQDYIKKVHFWIIVGYMVFVFISFFFWICHVNILTARWYHWWIY